MGNLYQYGNETIDLHDKNIPLIRRVAFGLLYLGRVCEFDFDSDPANMEFAMNFIREQGLNAPEGESVFDEFAKRKGEKLSRRFQVKKLSSH